MSLLTPASITYLASKVSFDEALSLNANPVASVALESPVFSAMVHLSEIANPFYLMLASTAATMAVVSVVLPPAGGVTVVFVVLVELAAYSSLTTLLSSEVTHHSISLWFLIMPSTTVIRFLLVSMIDFIKALSSLDYPSNS